MALKRRLNEHERFGLSQEEVNMSEKYLRKNKTAGAITNLEALKLYELYMVGCTFTELHQQHPQYAIPQIILTAALKGWVRDREKMLSSLKDRVQAKVVKSVIEQVDFLTTMLSVVNTEHLDVMRKYLIDPVNNPPPDIRIQNIKEYKEVMETLQKLITNTTNTSAKRGPSMVDRIGDKTSKPSNKQTTIGDEDAALLIAAEIS